MERSKNGDKRIIGGLNGLRVYAIAIIVACHTGFLSEAAGGIGNTIFFALSGFLAFYSIVDATGIKENLIFYFKKIMRIVPVFWTVLIIVWRMIPGTFSLTDFETNHSLILNMLFVKSYGHLWFLQHLMLMYLLTPVLGIIYRLIHKALDKQGAFEIVSDFISGAFFIILAVLAKLFLTPEVLTLAGEGSHSQFQIWVFLLGFATAVIGQGIRNAGKLERSSSASKIVAVLTDVYAVVFMVVMVLAVVPAICGDNSYIFISNRFLRTILACVLLFLLLISDSNHIKKVLDSKILMYLSKVSFGIYLWHFFLLDVYKNGIGIHDFLTNYFISMCLALFTYLCVEKNASKIVKKVLKN